MTPNKLFTATVLVAAATIGAAPSFAESRDYARDRHESARAAGPAGGFGRAAARESVRGVEQGHPRVARPGVGGRVVGRAVPRTAYVPRIVRPPIIGVVPYRPYVYRPRFSLPRSYSYPYGYTYPYGYSPYGYSPYGYSPYGYSPYGYSPYAYSPYGYGYPAPPGYINAVPGRPYGGVRIEGAPRDGAVYADGYYVGIVDDFDGAFQHMNLDAGPHRIEIRAPGYPPVEFDVNVQPGQTITYRADLVQP